MYRYQVWKRDNWSGNNASPEETCYTLDGAMNKAKELSKKPQVIKHPVNPFAPPGTQAETSTRYSVIFVLDCTQVPQKVRGIAYKGKWRDAVDNCKACKNSSFDEDDCSLCGGASWSPYRN